MPLAQPTVRLIGRNDEPPRLDGAPIPRSVRRGPRPQGAGDRPQPMPHGGRLRPGRPLRRPRGPPAGAGGAGRASVLSAASRSSSTGVGRSGRRARRLPRLRPVRRRLPGAGDHARGGGGMSTSLTVTRVVNACTLLELGGATVVTDPWFSERWYIHHWGARRRAVRRAASDRRGGRQPWLREPLGPADAAPPPGAGVSAGRRGHDVDAREARAIGFREVHCLACGASRSSSRPPSGSTRWRHRRCRCSGATTTTSSRRPASACCSVARHRLSRRSPTAPSTPLSTSRLLPVNGLCVPGDKKIVMDPDDAITAATALGADVLVLDPRFAPRRTRSRRVIRRTGTAADAVRLAGERPGSARVPVRPPLRHTVDMDLPR